MYIYNPIIQIYPCVIWYLSTNMITSIPIYSTSLQIPSCWKTNGVTHSTPSRPVDSALQQVVDSDRKPATWLESTLPQWSGTENQAYIIYIIYYILYIIYYILYIIYYILYYIYIGGGFLKWWYPTTIRLPTKNDHAGVFWGYHHLRKHPYISGVISGHTCVFPGVAF